MPRNIEETRKALEKHRARYPRTDSWSNPFTGLGTSRDKTTYSTFALNDRLTDEQAEALYAEDDIASRVCDTMPEYALRKGVNVKIAPNKEEETSDIEGTMAELKEMEADVSTKLTELKVISKFTDAAVWANVFGACGLLIGGADGADTPEALLEPLNEDAIKEITHLNTVDKRYMTPIKWYADPQKPKFGEPETYLITPYVVPGANVSQLMNIPGAHEIHETRLLMFDGIRTSVRRRQDHDGWKDSLLQRMQTVLKQFGTSWDTLAHIISDANQGVFKMKGLIDALSADDQDVISARLQLVDMSRSAVRAVVLDAEDEDFMRQNFTWTGIEKPFELLMYRLSAAARQPVSVIMGRAPAGMNATGEHDQTNFYDQIEAYRQEKLLENFQTLIRLIFKSKQGPTNGAEPENWTVEFPSLYTMTPREDAEIYQMTSDGDFKNVQSGILHANEVSLSRYGPDSDSDIVIDLESRTSDADGEFEEIDEEPDTDTDTDIDTDD